MNTLTTRLDSVETPLARQRTPHAEAATLRAAITRGWSATARTFPLFQSDSISFDRPAPIESECFSAATLLDLCGDAIDARTRREARDSLVEHLADGRDDLVRFFRSTRLPPDADCTAIVGLALWKLGALDRARAVAMARRLLGHRTSTGLISVYFDDGGERAERVDEVVTCNVLRFAAAVGVEEVAEADVAQIRAALGRGTRYYGPDALLLAAARLVRSRGDLRDALGVDLARVLRERLEAGGASIELACRCAAALHTGGETIRAIELALALRGGELRPEPFFSLGRRASYFGSQALTAGFRLHALGLARAAGGGHD